MSGILGFGQSAASKPQSSTVKDPLASKSESTGQYKGLGEELRDEKINQDLNQAFNLKSAGQNQKALEVYLMVLSQDFLKSSQLEQHIIMRLNAHKNVGEIYEVLENFKLAKNHYTSALKIKESDSWVWNKIGMIEYEKYGNLETAKQCFEASINTRPTLQKRSSVICPVMVKLAEINFKLQDYSNCEKLVDGILSRQSSPGMDAYAKLFAMKMKAFFHSLKGDNQKKQEILSRLEALTGQEGCSYHDLDIIIAFYKKIEFNMLKHGSNGIPIFDKNKQQYQFLKLKDQSGCQLFDQLDKSTTLSLMPERNSTSSVSLQGLFDEILEKMVQELDNAKESEKWSKTVADNLKFEAQGFIDVYKLLVKQYTNDETNEISYMEQITSQDSLRKLEQLLENQAQEHNQPQINSAAQAKNAGKGRGGKQVADKKEAESRKQAGTRRGLRQKMDFTAQQLSQLNLKTLDSYKDYIVSEYQSSISKKQQSGQSLDKSRMLETVFSQRELIQCKKLIENKHLFKNMDNNSSFLANDQDEQTQQHIHARQASQSGENATLNTQDLIDFEKLLNRVNGRRVNSVLRVVLQYAFDYNKKLVNFSNAVNLYKLFQYLMTVEGPFSQAWIHKQKEPWELYSGPNRKNDFLTLSGNSVNVMISIFELALFNKYVMKAVKSGPMMEQRQILFEFFNINEAYIHQLIEEAAQKRSKQSQDSSGDDSAISQHIRLIYSMMYCAFEIKNDMMQSVNLYQQLQSFQPILKQNQISIHLPWISYDYFLDNMRMAEFGDFKIKQAKIFKDYDSGLLKLKQREHQLIEEQRKAKQGGNAEKTKGKQQAPKPETPVGEQVEAPTKIDEQEFDKYASFYLDQFFLYLNASVSIQIAPKNGSSSDGANEGAQDLKLQSSSSCSQIQNEEKVKEMWSQMTYSLCRSTPALLFKATESLLCVFTVISYLNKTFYEQFILKKLDFEKILSSIHSRIQTAYNEVVGELKSVSDQIVSIHQIRDFAVRKIQDLFNIQTSGEFNADMNLTEQTLIKFQITLLRQLTPEFLHYNIFLTQSSNTVFQNILSSGGQNGGGQFGGSAGLGNINSNQAQSNNSIILSLGQQMISASLLINVFPQIFYYLEFFKSLVNSDPQKDNAYNLRTVTRFLIHIDKLAVQNTEKKEIFVRAYSQLVVQAFPVLIKCLKIDIARQNIGCQDEQGDQIQIQNQNSNSNSGYQQIQIQSSNSLLLFVSQVFKFFFDMKLSLDQLDEKELKAKNNSSASPTKNGGEQEDEDMDNEDDDEYSDEDEEDMHFRRQAHLSCLLGQLKREKQSKNWTQFVGNSGFSNKSPMLKFFINNSQFEMGLFADMTSIISFLMQEKPMKHGEMNLRIIKTVQTFNEVLIEYFVNNYGSIQEKISSSPGNQLIKRIKDTKTSPFALDLISKEFHVNSESEKNLNDFIDIKYVLNYLQNLFAHTILQYAPYQIARFDQAIKVGGVSIAPNTVGQNQAQPTSGTITNNFYFAYTKKGGALGNFPVQIAKIHENMLNLISNNEGQPVPQEPNGVSYHQYRNLSNAALRSLSRFIKLEVLLFSQLNSAVAVKQVTASNLFEQQIAIFQEVRLYDTIFSVSYMQSLVHFQQYMTTCGSTLFIAPEDIQNAAKQGKLPNVKKSDSDRKQRYLLSAVHSAILSLRFLVEKQKFVSKAQLDQSQLESISTPLSSDQNFFELSKIVLEQMLTVVISRIKILKLKNSLRGLTKLGPAQKSKDKYNQKIQNLKTTAYLIANICEQIDIYAAPNYDPRINNKGKQEAAQNASLDVLEKFLKAIEDSYTTDSAQKQKIFLQTEKAEECLRSIQETAEQNNFQSRRMEQRLNLDFVYSFIQAKYATSLATTFGLSQYEHKFMALRRSLEIAQANKNINGVLEAFRKLVQGSLQLAIQLRYNKERLGPQTLQENQRIIQEVVKPILQDRELKKYIVKDLGQRLLSGLRDSEIQDDQVQQLSHFMNRAGEENQMIQLDSSSIEESVIIHDTNSCKVRPNILMKEQAPGDDDFLSGNMALRKEENDMHQIYRAADLVNNNLSNSTKQWLKAKYQLMCAQSLLQEHLFQTGGEASLSELTAQITPEKAKLLVDMLKPINQTFLSYEDHWNGMVYDEGDKKNLITSINHQELLGLTQLRIKYVRFFSYICEQGRDYEPLKEIYKKKLQVFKQVDSSASGQQAGGNEIQNEHKGSTIANGTMLYELKILFDLSRNKSMDVLCSAIEDQLVKYQQVRSMVFQAMDKASRKGGESENKWKTQSIKQAKDVYDKMRRELQVTKDNVPSQLKEIFDLFVEIHSKKGFLVARGLISDQQKQMIIQAVLNCCAMCGPDSQGSAPSLTFDDKMSKSKSPKASQKSQIKFLELAKLNSPQYQTDGLIICIQWYLEVLDKQTTRKNQDFHRKLKVVMEEIKAKMNSQISRSVAPGGGEGPKPSGGQSLQTSAMQID